MLIWTTVAQGKKRCSASEQRKRDAALLYELKMESCKVGWGTPLWSTTRRRTYSASETVASPSPVITPTGFS